MISLRDTSHNHRPGDLAHLQVWRVDTRCRGQEDTPGARWRYKLHQAIGQINARDMREPTKAATNAHGEGGSLLPLRRLCH